MRAQPDPPPNRQIDRCSPAGVGALKIPLNVHHGLLEAWLSTSRGSLRVSNSGQGSNGMGSIPSSQVPSHTGPTARILRTREA